MSVRKERYIWAALSSAILVALIYIADIGRLIDALYTADNYLVSLSLIIGTLPYLVWGFTWYQIINCIGLKISYRDTLPLYLAGDFLNKVTPLGQFGGEPFMAYILSKKSDLSYEESFAAVLSSDIVNIVPMFTFIIIGGLFFVSEIGASTFLQQFLLVTLGVAVLGGSIVYLILFRSGTVERTIIQVLKQATGFIGKGELAVQKLEKKLESVEESFSVIGGKRKSLLVTVSVVHLAFTLRILCLYTVLLSLGIETNIYTLVFVLPLCSVSSFSPTPGGAGAYEGTMSLVLIFFHAITFTQALAAAILFRVATFGPALIIQYVAFNMVAGIENKSIGDI